MATKTSTPSDEKKTRPVKKNDSTILRIDAPNDVVTGIVVNGVDICKTGFGCYKFVLEVSDEGLVLIHSDFYPPRRED